MNLESLAQMKKGLKHNKINKLHELQFYTVIVLVLTLIGESFSLLAICMLLVIACVRFSGVFVWLNRQRYNRMQQSIKAKNSFEQLDDWQGSSNYYDQYNLSANLAECLFDTLKIKENCDFFELVERINSQTLTTQIPSEYNKVLYKYLQRNPVMWQAGFNKEFESKKLKNIPLSEIEDFSKYLLTDSSN